MSDPAETPPAAPETPAAALPAGTTVRLSEPGQPVTARSDPESFLYDADRLAEFVDKLRISGVKTFEHPSGLRFSFEPTGKLPAIRPQEGW